MKIKGLIRIVAGQKEWWPYVVARDRLRTQGSRAIARDFFAEYDRQRRAAQG